MSRQSSSATWRTQPRAESASFGELLSRYRLRAGLTQEMLAEQAEVSPAAIAALEQGLRHWPYPHTLKALATALELSVDEAESLAELARRPRRQAARSAPRSDATSRPVLPRPLTRLVGRGADMTQVQRLLERSPLVTLVGPGGIGKTRLALELGKLSAEQFTDGVAFAGLSPIGNPALIASTVAASVGIREQARAPLVRVLSEGLRTRHILLILDNCEHLVRDCAALAQQLLSECPALAILATSREPLAIAGELVWQVAPLELPDAWTSRSPEALVEHAAAELFVERVQATAPQFVLDGVSAPVVAEIVRRLDGIPLALELAATRVRSLGIVKLAERLDERLRLLVGGTSAPARQQTLRATLDWSYELLGPPERHLFARLAPFAGGWRLEDAEAICASDELPADAVVERLAKLVDQSLVVVRQPSGTTRYRLLDTMRHYAADRLNEDGLAELAYTAHRDHYLAEAEREPAERYSIAHIDWLSREADNLRAALRWSLDRDEFEVASRLAAALQGVWYVRGWLSEGRAWLNELVDRAGPAIESMQGARAIGATARLAYMQGDLASAASLAERCWQLADRLGDTRGLALATTRRAIVARGYGDLGRARALSEEALRRSRAVADVDLQVFSLYSLSVVMLVECGHARPPGSRACG